MNSKSQGLYPRRVPPKTTSEIAAEWDRVANQRLVQIESNMDLSRAHVLFPALLSLLPTGPLGRVLDVGCGTGQLADVLHQRAESVVGVDPSGESIRLARKVHGSAPSVEFVESSIESFARERRGKFQTAIANMVFMTMPNLEKGIAAIASLLADDGRLVFAITHPWFWPLYWGYAQAPWFQYNQEIYIEAPFEISLAPSLGITTHIHRPLVQYLDTLLAAGLLLDKCMEPIPERLVQEKYPQPWKYPRFLIGRCVSVP